jgi:hypothetical protein
MATTAAAVSSSGRAASSSGRGADSGDTIRVSFLLLFHADDCLLRM